MTERASRTRTISISIISNMGRNDMGYICEKNLNYGCNLHSQHLTDVFIKRKLTF